MADNTASNGHGQHNERRQNTSATTAGSPTKDEPRANNSYRQSVQPGRDLHYYRTFLEDLVAVVRDHDADTVSRIVALIRSGASNEEIYLAIQQLQAH
ncbi:hypothetical protein MYU51_002947 [Penicillium brevicompactum]|uniref:uncharacterized protein n=1 Tax=Penicillium brevicompactum TaxID=5074 RepID=UPI0025403338|nr:uncharacterized protein N7506_011258 [Penicillium brevicompactum]KAJ5322128.1 hypothetical protein N7506_011258 [Penicillium brevicompactum]